MEPLTTQDQIRATLAGDFWLTDYVGMMHTPTELVNYSGNESASTIVELHDWVKQFITDKSTYNSVTRAPFCEPNHPHKYVILAISSWGDTDVDEITEAALVHTINDQTEIWFGKDYVTEVTKDPNFTKDFPPSLKVAQLLHLIENMLW